MSQNEKNPKKTNKTAENTTFLVMFQTLATEKRGVNGSSQALEEQ